ncbi:MAG: right-handed parallel beta-helix repeat-containing protein [Gemmatimonadota bacterium]
MKRFAGRSLSYPLTCTLSALVLAACSTDVSPVAPVSPGVALGRDGDPLLSVGAGAIAIVTHDNDSGKGSLREAILQANTDPAIRRIEIKPANLTVPLASTIEYTGTQALTIIGKHAVIDASAVDGSAILVSGGADLVIEALTIRDAGGEGLEVQIPAAATGTVRVVLRELSVTGNAGHGVLINDQVDQSTTDGVQPNANGSAASLDVTIEDSRFANNGYSVSDRDGLRVNEGGDGDLTFTARGAIAEDNAADGIELDERGAGSVFIDVRDTRILRNGKFDPEDLDDGFDIDEYNDGSIVGTVTRTTANDNYEEGLDFNENNAGDLRVDLAGVEASRNREEGIDYEEDDDFAGGGDLVTTMTDIVTNGNGVDGGDAGLKIREKGVGNLTLVVTRVTASSNLIAGISIREDAAGSGTALLAAATLLGNAGGALSGNVIPTILP